MSVVMHNLDPGDGKKNFTAEFGCFSSSSSSSIGKNSDDEGGEYEAESSYKSPLDMMESLEEVLPIRRGISKFYNGKSKSFTSLKENECCPMKDMGRPENLYSRRRRNLLSHRICSRGGISKKPIKTSFAVVPSSGYDSHSRQSKESFGNCVPVVASPRCFQTQAGRNIHNIIC